MEDEDLLIYSGDKLSDLVKESKDKNLAVLEYLKTLNYPPIKDFKEGLEWFGVSEPLTFNKHLKGKVVLLDFFTYCCINCMHILPDLKEIEKEFSVEDGLVVIGVHSAKFENEKDSNNILAAVQRYNITHPVVNDSSFHMWKSCDVHCWPTLLLLGPNKNPIVMLTGEGHKAELKLYIKNVLDFYKLKNEISHHELPTSSAYHLLPNLKGPLLFPGKITSFIIDDDHAEILAVSDTGNHRILLLQTDGTVLKQIGNSREGFKDGSLEDAEFSSPQGLVFLDKNTLFVADTENHAIRRIDLFKDKVETVAGTGKQGNDMVGGNVGKKQILSSPWDLCIYEAHDIGGSASELKNVLIIAMAGTHQIWALFLDDVVWWKSQKYNAGTCICIAGSGREENRNNQYPLKAGFAQPSGLALCKKRRELYIADSESSSVRRLSLLDGKVSAVVGGDRNPSNLFAFGDRDGALHNAKLQHVLGLAVSKDEDTLFVADTYNHKVKKVDISKNSVTSLNSSNIGDAIDGKMRIFNEPAGLCASIDNKKLYIADTNNHNIKTLHLTKEGNIESTENILIKHVEAPKKNINKSELEILTNKSICLNSAGAKIILKLKFDFINRLKLTEEAPQKWVVDLPNTSWSCVPISGNNLENIEIVINTPSSTTNEFVDVIFNIVTCNENACIPKQFIIRQPIRFSNKELQEFVCEIKMIVDDKKITLQ